MVLQLMMGQHLKQAERKCDVMRRITLAMVVIAFGVLSFNSCIFDPKQEPEAPGPPAPAAYKDVHN